MSAGVEGRDLNECLPIVQGWRALLVENDRSWSCFICSGPVGPLAVEVQVFCAHCGPDWSAKSSELCSEGCALLYREHSRVDEHTTIDADNACVWPS